VARFRSTIVWLLAALLVTSAGCSRARFAAVADGVVRDRRTGLEWTTSDHPQSLAWDAAERHCGGLPKGASAFEWRIPELAELETLYDPHVDEPCGERRCHLDPAIRVGGPYVWTATERGQGTRFYFDFGYGTSFSPSLAPTLLRRTLCVRGTAP
jgi:hypothetical protein